MSRGEWRSRREEGASYFLPTTSPASQRSRISLLNGRVAQVGHRTARVTGLDVPELQVRLLVFSLPSLPG